VKNAGCVGNSSVTFPAGHAICGDFVVEVDFDISNWPGSSALGGRFNPILIRDTSGQLLAGIERYRENSNQCIPYTDSYKAYTTVPGCQGDANYEQTSSTTGTFRLERIGTIVRAHYFSGSGWVQIMERSIPAVDVRIQLNTGTNGALTSGHTSTFDNFTLYATGVTAVSESTHLSTWGRVKSAYR